MQLLDEANLARMRGDRAGATRLLDAAYQRERDAAMRLLDRTDLEPTRGILLKGAAVLAIQCGQQEEARDLLQRGLSGSPPAWLAEEMSEIVARLTPGPDTADEPQKRRRVKRQPPELEKLPG